MKKPFPYEFATRVCLTLIALIIGNLVIRDALFWMADQFRPMNGLHDAAVSVVLFAGIALGTWQCGCLASGVNMRRQTQLIGELISQLVRRTHPPMAVRMF